MIACLKGELFQKKLNKVIVNVNGVGYEVNISLSCHDRLPEVGREVFLHIQTNVREDAITLFGFWDIEEKEMFLLLTSVSGVGPKSAMGILSGIRPAELARAISTKDINRLTNAPGVGKKTAARLCVELKDKVDFVVYEGDEGGEIITAAQDDEGPAADVISALVNLGYPPVKAQQALAAVKKRRSAEDFAGLRVEDLLRETLRSLA